MMAVLQSIEQGSALSLIWTSMFPTALQKIWEAFHGRQNQISTCVCPHKISSTQQDESFARTRLLLSLHQILSPDHPTPRGHIKMADKHEDEHVIKPQTTTPAADTSDWPLLLKNYDKRAHSSP